DNMLPHEEDLFEDVKERIAEYREQHGTVLQKGIPAEDADGTGDTDDAADTAAETGTGVDDTGDSAPDTADEPEDEEEESTGGEEPVADADDDEAGDTGEPEDETAADDILQFGGEEEETAADSGGDGESGQDAPGTGDTEELEEEGEPAGEPDDHETDDEDDGRVTVEVQERVPEFMGTDLEAYGPFEEGDEVEVPEENADVLVQQGKAERA
ncbi:MAG: hypothetical protein SVY41_02725, partial [Candidatus Nanohaloarchaea archaeon]|nr:hypothetical protein [Candidatus Nanohaloarchaea archaeon]